MQTSFHRTSSRRAVVSALLLAVFLSVYSRPARADLVVGLDAALGVDSVFMVGSLISIGGNAADLARHKPTRGWMYSGFILGTANIAAGLITVFFGGDPVKYGNENTCMDKSLAHPDVNDPTMMVSPSFPCGPNTPQIAFGLGLAQTAIGITNLALAIRNAVIWNRQRTAEQQMMATTKEPSLLSRLSVAPVVGRGLAGMPVYGVTVGLSSF